ncbi:MAG: hypothetical protein NT020_11685 [Chloroflexales bacterium]|nr:hypothetical protein [Chloroflexales bacterium]
MPGLIHAAPLGLVGMVVIRDPGDARSGGCRPVGGVGMVVIRDPGDAPVSCRSVGLWEWW